MNYFFDTDIAAEYGVDEAIVIQNLEYWIFKSEANNKHFHEGRFWTYNSAEAFRRFFPFWSASQIRRILQSLRDKDVIITGNFNPSAYDRTTWYAFSDSYLQKRQIHFTKSQNGESEIQTPIPNIKQDINPNFTDSIFQPGEIEVVEKKKETTREKLCLFADSKFFNFDAFKAALEKDGKYAGADFEYYYECIKNWSASKGAKKYDWIATARNWMLSDFRDGKLKKTREAVAASEADEWADALKKYAEEKKRFGV